jgi:acetyl esterase
MDDRLDPQMRAARQEQDRLAAQYPAQSLTGDLDASRAIGEVLNGVWAQGGPQMATTTEHWILVRGRQVRCRMHRPTTAARLPVLVWFHGGGWVVSSIDTHDRLGREHAAAGLVAVIMVDYALAPEAKFPQALLECAGVVRALAQDAATWGIDPDRIVLGGDSAGGNLAFATALLLRDTQGPALRGILADYPVTEATCDTASYTEFSDGFGLSRAQMLDYWDLYLRDPVDRLHPLASPLRAALAGLPPCLIQIAELDVLRDDGLAMATALAKAGVAVEVETIPGVLHGFMRLSGAVDAAAQAIARAGVWLARVAA